jgi:outer membrane protein OmpA-like peptidoglycan-associated protein
VATFAVSVNFATDRTALSDAARNTVREAAAALRSSVYDDKATVLVLGHTDDLEDENSQLAFERARVVEATLVAEHVPSKQIRTKAAGSLYLTTIATPGWEREPQSGTVEILIGYEHDGAYRGHAGAKVGGELRR